ncbi:MULTISPECIES: septation ring formation regulator EzrA [Ruoffia]|uniref:Septation ring formation regulator EzrA n=1 Tax=Ruoffia tabacinasalis TaxID=87458 RepID=A0A5R9EP27_9LACT|nr:septation ring formation regulator EzrA [Ruoffia tabacinasalis]MBG9978453.1 selenide, water dikinase [Ruoffia tabacinasalis]TLQ49339.1 selenide, water dikinase [Ruoffia tabacinasalis]HBY90658.1 selenide, water dikinase [Aerococcaceae bacterium]HJG48169.1 septation ring formation regulator EzrA [Ruoffia tabacinasalis]
MNLTFTDILFIIVILFLVASGVIFYLRTQRAKEIRELENRKDEMMSISIADQLFTLKNMDLAGQTKRKYESLVATWQTLTNFQFTEIEAMLVGAEQYSEQMNLMKAKTALDEARDLLDETEVQVHDLHDELTALLKISEDNHERNEALLERYNTARKSIMNHSFDYGPAIETLEKNLQYLELNFTRYNELTTAGDHIEADDMLDTIEADLGSLEDILEKLPSMYNKIKKDYEDALEDILDGHQKMLESHFNFEGVDVPEKAEEIQEKLNEAKNHIKNADLVDAQTLMDKADREINSLYDFMEAEIEAKNYVNTHINQLRTRFEEVRENNRYAGIEVDRIAQSYILHENEVDQIGELTEQINAEYGRFTDTAGTIESDGAVFTQVAEQLSRIEKNLNEYDSKQQKIVKDLGQLNAREREAKTNLDSYELDLRNMKRRLEKQHLPGLSSNYYEIFYKVTDEIEYLSKQLNRVRIDMVEIEGLEKQLAENLNKLDELTESTVDSATLTEYMIQHSNRFRFDYPEMDQAIHEAEYLFYDEFRYDEALNVIEKALYRVDREGPTQVRRMYQQEKQNRVF